MRAAGLHPIETLLQTEAVLIRSAVPKHEQLKPIIDMVQRRIAGFVASKK